MLRLRSILVAVVAVLVALTVPMSAHNVTVSGTVLFSSLDGGPLDHDGVANGVFTVNDGNLTINGTVSCNDDAPAPGNASACNMAFNVSGDLTIGSGAALLAENRRSDGNGGNITLTVGGQLTLAGATLSVPGALVSSSRVSGGGKDTEHAGAITFTVNGNVTMQAGSVVAANAARAPAGVVTILSGGQTALSGLITSGPSTTVVSTALTGRVLSGGDGHQVGKAITVQCTGVTEPGLVVNGAIVSQSQEDDAGHVTLSGCGIVVKGLVASVAIKKGASRVSLLSGTSVSIDGRDYGDPAPVLARFGRVRADVTQEASTDHSAVDIFANDAIEILGPNPALTSVFAVTANERQKPNGTNGAVRVRSLHDTLTASGNAVQAGSTEKDDFGGSIELQARNAVTLDGAFLSATGDFSGGSPHGTGGTITVQSFAQGVSWTNGGGDVRPTGSAVAVAKRGTITITACGTTDLTGSVFPVNGSTVPPFPVVVAACPGTDPQLPEGVELPTCLDDAPAVSTTSPVDGATDVAANSNIVVTFTEPVNVTDSTAFTLECPSGTPIAFNMTPAAPGGTTAFTLDPVGPLPGAAVCTVVVVASKVTDVDTNDPPDNMAANYTFSFTVHDDPPVAADDSATVLEDSGATFIDVLANDSNPDGGPKTVNSASDPANGTVVITGGGTGVTYQPDPNYCNSPSGSPDTFTYTLNGGSTATVYVTVTCVNDAPSFTKGADENVLEDSGAHTVPGWATAISAGPANESSQTVTFEITGNTNPALFAVGPAVSSSGTLTYTLAANEFGTASITLRAKDDGGVLNGGVDTSATQTFDINVANVNDAPSFTKGADQTVNEDSGPQTVSPWATGISAGPANESGQVVDFVIDSNDNPTLFSAGPSVAADGTLTFTPAANQFGVANITLHIHDNGGTAGGGVNASATQSFVITVNSVNDAPSFTKGADENVLEDSGAHTVPGWATAISAGPANESSQTVTFEITNNTNAALFSVQPAVSSSGTLTYTLAANEFGTASITLRAKDDGGVLNGGVDTSATQTFDINVANVNDAPSFTKGADQTVNEDSGPQTVSPWATGISAGPANESGQVVDFVIDSNDNPTLFSAGPSVAADGTLTFTPAANQFGVANITLHIHDDGGTAGGGVNSSATQSFVITVNAVNDAPSFTKGADESVLEDSGAHTVPSWATAISAGPANESSQTVTFEITNNTNPALFSVAPAVDSSGTLTYTLAANEFGTAAITLRIKDDGGVLNGGVDTSATQTFNINVADVNDAPSFTKGPDQTANEDSGAHTVIGWATGISAGPANESGQTVNFVIDANDNPGLFSAGPSVAPNGTLTYTLAANQNGVANITLHIHDNGGTTGGGVDDSPTQSFVITVTAINDPPVAQNKNYNAQANMKIVGLTGLLAGVTDADTGTGSPACTPSFTVSSVSATAPAGGTVIVTNPSAGTFDFDPPPGITGNVTFTYTVDDDGCPGIATSAPATVTVNVAGPVIWFVNNAVVGPGDGRLSNPFKTLALADAVDAVNHRIFLYSGTYATGIVLNAGESLIGQGVSTASDPSFVNFDVVFGIAPPAGTIARPSIAGTRPTVQNTVTVNTGSAVRGLNLSTGTSTGLTDPVAAISAVATSEVSVTTTTATAVNLSNIGGTLVFTSISSNGGSSNGISLTNQTGSFTVTGTGAAASGGTIQNKTGADGSTTAGIGISLSATSNVSLDWMQLNNFTNYGILGNGVSGFVLNHTTINGVNGTSTAGLGEGSVYFTGLTGTASVSNSSISGGVYDTFHVFNSGGVLNRLTITSSTFAMTNTSGNDAVVLQANGGTFNATVQSSNITAARGDLFQLNLLGTLSSDLVFGGATPALGNTLTNNNLAIVSGGGGVTIGGGSASNNVTFTYNIANNSMRGANGAVLAVTKGAGPASTFTGTIANNTIGQSGVFGSGSTQGEGIAVYHDGAGTSSTTITNNQVYGVVGSRGAIDVLVQNGGGGHMTALIQGNTIGTLDQLNSFAGMYVQTGSNPGAGGDNNTACLTIGGAGGLKNTIDVGTNAFFSIFAGVIVEQEGTSRVGLLGTPNYSGGVYNDANVETYVGGNNMLLGLNAQPAGSFHDGANPPGGGFFGSCPP